MSFINDDDTSVSKIPSFLGVALEGCSFSRGKPVKKTGVPDLPSMGESQGDGARDFVEQYVLMWLLVNWC